MSPEELRAKREQLSQLLSWMQGSYMYLPVELENNEYYLDFGCLGEQTISVTLSDEGYQFDPMEVLEHNDCPMGEGDLNSLIDSLDEAADQLEAETATELEPALQAIAVCGEAQERKLAAIMLAVLPHLRRVTTVAGAGAPQPLPGKPLPWPGSDVEGIDYTDPEFPRRYEPPPDWAWSNSGKGSADMVHYEDAEPVSVADLKRGSGIMIITKQGRVSWRHRGDDDLADGVRWRVWEATSGSGILTGFNGSSEPVPYPGTEATESTSGGGFAPPATVSV